MSPVVVLAKGSKWDLTYADLGSSELAYLLGSDEWEPFSTVRRGSAAEAQETYGREYDELAAVEIWFRRRKASP